MRNLHLTTAPLGLRLAPVILWLLQREHLHLVRGLFWFSVAGLAAVLCVWPGLIDRLAVLAGMSYPPALLFLGQQWRCLNCRTACSRTFRQTCPSRDGPVVGRWACRQRTLASL